MPKLSRRHLLGSAGAAVGAGTLGVLGAAPADAATKITRLVLTGSQMRVLGTGGRTPGESTTVRGLLHQGQSAAVTGEFFATATVLAVSQMFEPELGSYETHLFTTKFGTITGSGVVRHDGSGHFTITGGSGRYASVRGTYVSQQSADTSGTGQALFTFTFDGAL